MKRSSRIALIVSGSVVLLLAIAAIAVVMIGRSAWLREKLRTTIIEQAEKATGGRVEVRAFRLDWTTLEAEVDGFVIHGTESASEAPFLAIDKVVVGFRILSIFTRDIRLDRVDVTHPRAHVIIEADGKTNVPRPKTPGTGHVGDEILNLKIGHVAIHNGEGLVESPGTPDKKIDARSIKARSIKARSIKAWSGEGRNVEARATYESERDRYAGTVSITPAHLTLEGYGPLDVEIHADAAMERNRVTASRVTLKTAGSQIVLTNGSVGTFAAPVVVADYDAKISAAEADRVLHWKAPMAGIVNAAGTARYVSPREFTMSGSFHGSGLSFDRVHNIGLAGDLTGDQAKMTLANLRVTVLGGSVAGSLEIDGYETYHARGNVKGLGVRQVAALGTPRPIPYDGIVSGSVDASGTLKGLSNTILDASAQLTLSPASAGAPVHGEISANYKGAERRLELGHSWVELPHTRVDLAGTLGATLAVSLNSTDLNDLLPLLNGRVPPFTLRDGSVSVNARVTGALANPQIAARAVVTNAVYNNQLIDSASADLEATMNHVAASNLTVTSAGMTARGSGSLGLVDWSPSASSVLGASIMAANIDLTHLLNVAGQKGTPVTGNVSLNAHIAGTLGQPVGTADLTLARGTVYQQPFDSITAHVEYVNPALQTATGTFVSGVKRVNFGIRYPHQGQTFPVGTFDVSIDSNSMPLNQISLIRQRQPDIEGAAEFHGSIAVRIGRDNRNALTFALAGLNGDGSATGLALEGRDLGDAHFTARTQGSTVTANFDSNAAKASIRGQAKVELTGNEPITGSIALSNAGVNAIAALLLTPAEAKKFNFDGTVQGQLDFSGPLSRPQQISATANIAELEIHPLPKSPLADSMPNFSLHNVGAMKISLANSVIRVESMHVQAPETDMTVSGQAALTGSSPLDLRLQGTANLVLLRNVVPDLASSGSLAISGMVRGSWSSPDVSGIASLRGGEFHYADFTNGLTNATGDIVFSGSRATIRSFTADTGGGKFSAAGFATLSSTGNVAFQISAGTRDVRVRYPPGVSSVSDSDIQIVRNPQRSSITGTVTVRRLVINPEEDTRNILAGLSDSQPTPPSGDSVFANMNLDVQIQTAPDVALQSKVAQSIQADANLRLRGTVSNPAMLGRVNISQGEVIFFGNKYTISQGVISFFNPTKIEPILNVDLQTKARGVEVTLTVTGPPSKLSMTYRSDPPLEFSDIVALLATGRTPDDPSVALRGGNAPTQSFEQLGASTVLGQAVANPVAGRLQRFFGVSRLKIDPQLSSATGSPGARLTVEQQVTPDILFTYITDVSNTSQQLIRVEWAFSPKWSAILERGEDGFVGLDFAYKKRFK